MDSLMECDTIPIKELSFGLSDNEVREPVISAIDKQTDSLRPLNSRPNSIFGELNKNEDKELSAKENNETDAKNQMINVPKLLSQLVNARVVLNRLPDSIVANKLPLPENLIRNSQDESIDISVSKENTKNIRFTYATKRYCSTCKTTKANAKVRRAVFCNECGNSLDFQCAHCNKLYFSYAGLYQHLDFRCNHLTKKTRNTYTERQKFKCNHCAFEANFVGNLRRHERVIHKIINQAGFSCNVCNIRYQHKEPLELHQKTCGKTILRCEFCPYQSKILSHLKKHITIKHSSERLE